MQIKLLRASLAEPSDRSGVATRFIAKKFFRHRSHSPDTMTAHWRQRDPTKHRDTLITSGHFRSSPEIQPTINTHRSRHTPTA